MRIKRLRGWVDQVRMGGEYSRRWAPAWWSSDVAAHVRKFEKHVEMRQSFHPPCNDD